MKAPGPIARLVYIYTAVCVIGAVVIFILLAAWHRMSTAPTHHNRRQELRHSEQRPPRHEGRPPRHEGRPPRHERRPRHDEERPASHGERRPRRGPPGVTPPNELLLWAGMAILFLVSVASFFFSRRLVMPLRKLESTASAFGAGEYSVRIGNTTKDEIGAASRAFDEMADRTSVLIQSQRELIANVSHEFRTPLARMRVALDLAEERNQAKPEILQSLQLDITELQGLVGNVLELLRVAMTEGLEKSERINLTKMLEALVVRFQEYYPGRNIELTVPKDLYCFGEPLLLSRAMGNLLDNALKYSKEDVFVSVDSTPDTIQVEFRDCGQGIAADDLQQVFTPFFRADRSRHRASGGIGLGLSLVQRIIEAHHGRVVLESQHGVGTTASITLPVENTIA